MHESIDLIFSFFLIFSGAAVVATIALFTRQPMIIAYIALGALFGPYALGFIKQPQTMAHMSEIGIIFLLFLLGLDMQPATLIKSLRKTTVIGLFSSAIFAGAGYWLAILFGYNYTESMIMGLAMMFSSTIIGIKLLPTTVLHHKHTGALMVSILLLQDIIAITVLMVVNGMSDTTSGWQNYALMFAALPALIIFAWVFVKYVLLKLLMRFDRIQEYIFLLAIGWCLGLSELAALLGLSQEIGAFIAGITIASSPISQFIAMHLKPLRDFFLILFFFAIGASFDLSLLPEVILPALAFAGVMLVIKPVSFRWLLHNQSESNHLAWDVGFRLGQISEFSLLIAYIAAGSHLISNQASHVIQATAIITFAISSYIVVLNFSNPIAVKDELRRD
jgi:Kef-type K+ transport system membrane component KefB